MYDVAVDPAAPVATVAIWRGLPLAAPVRVIYSRMLAVYLARHYDRSIPATGLVNVESAIVTTFVCFFPPVRAHEPYLIVAIARSIACSVYVDQLFIAVLYAMSSKCRSGSIGTWRLKA